MICKKCNTAVNDDDKVCRNCGAPLNKNNKRIIIISVVLVALAIGAILYFNRGGADEGGEALPLADMDERIDENENINIIDENILEDRQEEEKEAEEDPMTLSMADFEKSIDEVWSMLDETAFAVYDYYDRYSDSVTFVSKNGYFFEVPASAYVVTSDLLDLTAINEEYTQEDILFLYLRPNDLRVYEDLRVSSSEELKIFVAYETKEGFAITSKDETGGIIPRENLQQVLQDYAWQRGNTRKVAFDSNEYNRIITALAKYTGNSDGFDVRYMYMDDQYAAAVVSTAGNHKDLSLHILENFDELFAVKVGNLEGEVNYKKAINDELPGFNLDMLPDYNLATEIKFIHDDYTAILDELQIAGIVLEEDLPVTFACGAHEFVYFEFTSGLKFLGHYNDDTWEMYIVDQYETAVAFMNTLARKPPLYILKQF